MGIKTYVFAFFLLLHGLATLSAQENVSGTVTDQTGLPLPGVSIVIVGTTNGTQTDFDGNYTIAVNPGQILRFIYIGQKTVDRTVGTSTIINVQMEESAEALEEVVVTGQGITREKKTLGYATQSVNTELIQLQPQPDIGRLLDGQLAGVDINSTGGASGSGSSVIIRSIGNLTGDNQPLWVVDGVPFQSGTDNPNSFADGGGIESSRFLDIDPNNILDIQVLKGLAATTIYGDQGKNGVILVTTKNSDLKTEAFSLDVAVSTYFQEVANLPNYQGTYGNGNNQQVVIGNIGNWGDFMDGRLVPHPLSGAEFADIFPEFQGVTEPHVNYKNNVRDFFRKGFGQTYNVSGSGGSEKLQYNVGFNYTDEDGIIPESGLTRYGFNVGGRAKINDKLSLSGSANFVNTNIGNPPVAASNSASGVSVFTRLLFVPRSVDLTGLPYQNPIDGSSVFYGRPDVDNPYWLVDNARNTEDIERFFGKLQLDYKLTENLNFTYQFGLDTYTNKLKFHINRGSTQTNLANGRLREDIRKNELVTHNFLLKTDILNFGDFGLDALVGFQSRRDVSDNSLLISDNQIIFGRVNHDNFSEAQTDQSYFDRNVFGAYAQANLSFKNYVYFSASARNDWVSNLETQNNSALYPSASLSFIATDAFPSIKSEVLNYIKFRGSFASAADFPELGYPTAQIVNLDGQDFRGISTIGNSNTTNNAGPFAILGNRELKPVLHNEREFGLETRLFNSRLNIDVTYFNRISKDQILDRQLDGATGFVETSINAGEVETDGLEIALKVTPLRSDDFSWDINTNFFAYETTVVDLPEGSEQFFTAGFSNLGNFAVEGAPINSIVGNYTLRNEDGDYLINPENGRIISSDEVGLDDRIIGDPNPDWTLNVINGFTYKNLTLRAQVDYVHGGDVYSSTIQNLYRRGVTKDTEQGRQNTYVLPGVYADPNTGEVLTDTNGNQIANNTQIAANSLYFGNLVDPADGNIYDASRIRLRNVTFSYALPQRFAQDLGFTALSFTLTGDNLWYKAFNIPEHSNVDLDINSVGVGTASGLDFQTALNSRRFGMAIKASF